MMIQQQSSKNCEREARLKPDIGQWHPPCSRNTDMLQFRTVPMVQSLDTYILTKKINQVTDFGLLRDGFDEDDREAASTSAHICK